jgi:hypothetical protein
MGELGERGDTFLELLVDITEETGGEELSFFPEGVLETENNPPPSFLVGVGMGSDRLGVDEGVIVGEEVGEKSFLPPEVRDARAPGVNCIETGRPVDLVGAGS